VARLIEPLTYTFLSYPPPQSLNLASNGHGLLETNAGAGAGCGRRATIMRGFIVCVYVCMYVCTYEFQTFNCTY
jgi:hypothetical protein